MAHVVQEACRRLKEAGGEVTVLPTAGVGHATELAGCVPAGTRAVVAVGGDGTVREVAQGVVCGDIPLAVLPAGTENLVAKHFGYKASAAHLLSTLLTGRSRRIDVGWAGQSIFLIVAGIGFDAEIVHRLSRARAGNISRLSYLSPIWATFWKHRFPMLNVRIEGRPVYQGRGLLFIGNVPPYGPGLRILQKANCSDGRLDLCICPCSSRLTLGLHAARILARCHLRFGDVLYEKVQTVTVESSDARVPMQLDGDVAGHLPAQFRVQACALSLLIPGSPASGLSDRSPL
jgi:diacylglycerol kinase family enzyme